MSTKPTPGHIKLDERQHVELPFLRQLEGLGWNIVDLTDRKQTPANTGRTSFTEVVLEKRLRAQLKVIDPWLADDQVDDVVKQLTTSFPGNDLMKNNQHLRGYRRGSNQCKQLIY